MSGDALAQHTVAEVNSRLSEIFDALGVRARTRGLAAVLPRAIPEPAFGDQEPWDELVETTRALTAGDSDPEIVESHLRALKTFRRRSKNPDTWTNELIASIKAEGVWAYALDVTLDALGPRLPELMINPASRSDRPGCDGRSVA